MHLKTLLFFFCSFIVATPISAQNDYKKLIQLSYSEIDSIMMMLYQKGSFEKCIPLMLAGQDKAKVEFGEMDSTFSEYTNNLAFFYYQTGQFNKALPLYKIAINIDKKTLGVFHPNFTTSLNNLASLHGEMGNFNLALPLFIQAKNIREKTLGILHFDFTTSLNNLAGLHQDMGNHQLALPLYIQAKNIREKILGTEHPDFAITVNNLASLHNQMGNNELALPLYIQAKEIWKKSLGVLHPDFALSLDNLAGLYQDMGNYQLALPLYIQAKNTREKVLGPLHPGFANSINSLARLYKEMGAFKLALPLFIQAKNIREKSLGSLHPHFAQTLNHLADLHKKMGNYTQSWKLLEQVLQITSGINISINIDKNWADSLFNTKYPSNLHLEIMIHSLDHIYTVLSKNKAHKKIQEKQKIVANLAIQLLNKLQHQLPNEKDKLRILKSTSAWLEKNLDILDTQKQSSIAFQFADQNKSVLLLQATKSEEVYKLGHLPDSLIYKDKKMLKKQNQLQAKLAEKRSNTEKDSLRNELIHVNQNIDDFTQLLKKDYPKYHKLKYHQIDTKTEDIQALLEDNTALLEYVISDSIIHIFYLDKNQVEWKKVFVSKGTLKKNIKNLHQALSSYNMILNNQKKAYRKYTLKAHWFYKNLLAPVLKDKKNIQNLILVTDGELGHLPFESFLVKEAPQNITDYHLLHYLVNDYNISYNYSAVLWKENMEAPSPQNNGQILAMAANYNMKLDSSILEIRLPTDQLLRNKLNPLPAARKEVETLQKRYQGFFAFDALASEKTVKEKAFDFAILHFATHGILDSRNPMLSSLAFSENNDSLESNFWQAHEISKTQLKANLVVLSSCKSGFGKFEKGNGIASLSRAFMYAGASSLIVSLWQVNDYATSEIMKIIYANLANGMKKDEALRHAKIQYMKSAEKKFAHPAFWSSFIQIGNTQPISIKRKNTTMYWIICTSIILALLSGIFFMSKKNKTETIRIT
jgi:CHAT domain-containing protein